ncbi:MAG: PIG-L family deacetylase [Chloroflexales bacterium]|nr:PIG-L family deacetylase [Chloroflexales bacterium]
MAILAHPDDESLGFGGVLAKYAAEGVATTVVTATRGQQGWAGDPRGRPDALALGRLREAELRAATQALGVHDLVILDYQDGALAHADPEEATSVLVTLLRRLRPDVVVTFGPDGAYGHPDHIAISQLATAAVCAASDSAYRDPQRLAPHSVAKLYYLAITATLAAGYEALFGELAIVIDGTVRRQVIWPDWAVTTHLDTSAHWAAVVRAVACHASQLPRELRLAELPPETHRQLWGRQCFYRAMSRVSGGRQRETDLFAGVAAGGDGGAER